MLHIVRLIERRHPRYADRIASLLPVPSACTALAGAALPFACH